MFDRIAGQYDTVNTVLSAGTDAGWRRRAAREAGLREGASALDVACGSGKLTAQLAKVARGGRVVGLDFSPRMLEIARRAHPEIDFLEGDALNLPFEDASFDLHVRCGHLHRNRNAARHRQGIRSRPAARHRRVGQAERAMADGWRSDDVGELVLSSPFDTYRH